MTVDVIKVAEYCGGKDKVQLLVVRFSGCKEKSRTRSDIDYWRGHTQGFFSRDRDKVPKNEGGWTKFDEFVRSMQKLRVRCQGRCDDCERECSEHTSLDTWSIRHICVRVFIRGANNLYFSIIRTGTYLCEVRKHAWCAASWLHLYHFAVLGQHYGFDEIKPALHQRIGHQHSYLHRMQAHLFIKQKMMYCGTFLETEILTCQKLEDFNKLLGAVVNPEQLAKIILLVK